MKPRPFFCPDYTSLQHQDSDVFVKTRMEVSYGLSLLFRCISPTPLSLCVGLRHAAMEADDVQLSLELDHEMGLRASLELAAKYHMGYRWEVFYTAMLQCTKASKTTCSLFFVFCVWISNYLRNLNIAVIVILLRSLQTASAWTCDVASSLLWHYSRRNTDRYHARGL